MKLPNLRSNFLSIYQGEREETKMDRMKSGIVCMASLIGVLSFIAVLLPPTAATAQDVVQEVEKARLRITCIQPDANPALHGRLTSFFWARNGDPLKVVTKSMPLVCDNNTAGVADPETETDTIRTSDGVTIGVPRGATAFHYRLVAHEVNADDKRLPRTVCEGDVNFKSSVGDLDALDPMRGDLPKYSAYCHLGGGSRVAFRVRPFIKEIPIMNDN